jgi:hypothetical protein
MHPRGSAVSSRSPRGFSFGRTSASFLASVAVIGAYRRVMRISAAHDAAAKLAALAWLGDDPPEHGGAN